MRTAEIAELHRMAEELALEPETKAGGPGFRVAVGLGKYGFTEKLDVSARHGAVWERPMQERVVSLAKAKTLMRKKAVELDRKVPRAERLIEQSARRRWRRDFSRSISASVVKKREQRKSAVCHVCGRRNFMFRPGGLPENQKAWFLLASESDDKPGNLYTCPEGKHLPHQPGETVEPPQNLM